MIYKLCEHGKSTCLLWALDSLGKTFPPFLSQLVRESDEVFGEIRSFLISQLTFCHPGFQPPKAVHPMLSLYTVQITQHMNTRQWQCPLSFIRSHVLFMPGSTKAVPCSKQTPPGKTAVTRPPENERTTHFPWRGRRCRNVTWPHATWQWSLEWRQKLTNLLTLTVSFDMSCLHFVNSPLSKMPIPTSSRTSIN